MNRFWLGVPTKMKHLEGAKNGSDNFYSCPWHQLGRDGPSASSLVTFKAFPRDTWHQFYYPDME